MKNINKKVEKEMTINDVGNLVIALTERVGGVENKLGGLEYKIDSLDKRIVVLDNRLLGLEERMDAFGNRMDGLENKIHSVEINLSNKIYNLGVKLDQAVDDITRATAKGFIEVHARIDTLQAYTEKSFRQLHRDEVGRLALKIA